MCIRQYRCRLRRPEARKRKSKESLMVHNSRLRGKRPDVRSIVVGVCILIVALVMALTNASLMNIIDIIGVITLVLIVAAFIASTWANKLKRRNDDSTRQLLFDGVSE